MVANAPRMTWQHIPPRLYAMNDILNHKLKIFSERWIGWVGDDLIERAGITFDRTPAGDIAAPSDMFRVCAYHIDFDERPTSYQDLSSLHDAKLICERLPDCRGPWNVDYAAVFDDKGEIVVSGRPY